ncbi:MAG: rod shape-determining protein MreC [Ramlibacter sp.]|nr:rod shape-determining protein MreC [Ramlibacter sp.]
MPLGTLDRNPPPFFKQGPSAISKLMVFSAIALFLMVADTRFKIAQPVRSAIGTALYPVQWLAMQPVMFFKGGFDYFESLESAQRSEAAARAKLALQAQRGFQVEQLTQENERLRKLLELRARFMTTATAAEVLYDAADPYTRKIIIDKGSTHQVKAGSPVIDESGVLGQVTRVHLLISEVTLITDREQAIPVLNARTGSRSVAYGDPSLHGGSLELRFMAANADVQPGDLLTTSGVDGVYPSGVPVATVEKVDRRADSGFARITCRPQALVAGARHVMVLAPMTDLLPPRPAPEDAAPSARKGGRR